ncbi:MAG: GNAT family N-acetyltransferase [Vicinamibacterales bacterium]
MDRATKVLSAEFRGRYTPELIAEILTDPQNVLLVSNDPGREALAVVVKAGSEGQKLLLMWVSPDARREGVGSRLLRYIIQVFTTHHFLSLHCHSGLEGIYLRHGFHPLFTTDGFCYMAGPAASRDEVEHLSPPFLRTPRPAD